MNLLAIYFTANVKWKLIDVSILTIFPHTVQGKKEEHEKRFKYRCFFVNFFEFLRTPFLRTSPVVAFEDEHEETKLQHMTSRLGYKMSRNLEKITGKK